eukprot:TRINITY_DN58649_c0_g1_i1.p1 TRINITY_DN58649_c0_g1~~TRINITY_DN58649_c0_g1_i1.p1  ORF type:complete len:753 (-),score=198.15 TRINITY_DN58649_c0_g1_i1:324-2582(-)
MGGGASSGKKRRAASGAEDADPDGATSAGTASQNGPPAGAGIGSLPSDGPGRRGRSDSKCSSGSNGGDADARSPGAEKRSDKRAGSTSGAENTANGNPTAWPTPATAAAAASAPGAAKIRCDRCGAVRSISCGTVVFDCMACGATVRVVLGAVAKHARTKVSEKMTEAEQAIKLILDEQTSVCKKLWEQLDDEIAMQKAMWRSNPPSAPMLPPAPGDVAAGVSPLSARATSPRGPLLDQAPPLQPPPTPPGGAAGEMASLLLEEAAQARDVAQVQEALSQAVDTFGLPPISEALAAALERLRQEEDYEVMWRCLLRALREADRVELQLWCDEAVERGLLIPEPVKATIEAIEGDERARLAELGYQAELDARVLDASKRGDKPALEALIREAELLGADTSSAEAALLNCMAREATDIRVSGEIARLTEQELRTALIREGVDVTGIEAISELQQLLAAIRGVSAHYSPRAPRHAATTRVPPPPPPPAGPQQQQQKAHDRSTGRRATAPGQMPQPTPSPKAKSGFHCPTHDLDAAMASSGCDDPFYGSPKTPRQGVQYQSPKQSQQQQQQYRNQQHFQQQQQKQQQYYQQQQYQQQQQRYQQQYQQYQQYQQQYQQYQQQRSAPGFQGASWSGAQASQQQSGAPRYGSTPFTIPKAGGPAGPSATTSAPKNGWPLLDTGGPMTRAKALRLFGLERSDGRDWDPPRDEVRRAYKQAALRWHPDRLQNHACPEEAKKRFQDVRAAFDLLQSTSSGRR